MSFNSNTLSNAHFTALPQCGHAALIHRLYREKLKKSLLSLIGSVEKALNEDYNSIKQKYVDLNLEERFSPRLYYLHHHLQSKMRLSDIESVKNILASLDKMPAEEIYCPTLIISSGIINDWERFVVEEAQKIKATNAAGERPEIFSAPIANLKNIKASIQEALELIQTYDSVMKEQFDEYIAHLKVFDGKGMIGMTDVRIFGAIFLRAPLPQDDATVYFIEHLIHETSHLHLNAIMSHDPLISNSPDELYPAPIRLDLRPMYGVLHATYVLSRIVRFFKLAAKCFPHKEGFIKTLSVTERQFNEGYKIVKSYARCTEVGKQVMESLIPTSTSLIAI